MNKQGKKACGNYESEIEHRHQHCNGHCHRAHQFQDIQVCNYTLALSIQYADLGSCHNNCRYPHQDIGIHGEVAENLKLSCRERKDGVIRHHPDNCNYCKNENNNVDNDRFFHIASIIVFLRIDSTSAPSTSRPVALISLTSGMP